MQKNVPNNLLMLKRKKNVAGIKVKKR